MVRFFRSFSEESIEKIAKVIYSNQILIKFMPRFIRSYIALIIASICFNVPNTFRKIILYNISQVYEEQLSFREIRKIGAKYFQELFKNLFEAVELPNPKFISNVEIDGIESLFNSLRRGKGIILLSAHIGNIGILLMRLKDLNIRIHVVAALEGPFSPLLPFTNHDLISIVPIINYSHPWKIFSYLVNCLKKNEVILIMGDSWGLNHPGVYFFNRLSYSPTGAAFLALKTSATVIPIFIHRNRDGKYMIQIEEPVKIIKIGDMKRDILINIERFNEIIQEKIKANPEQWYMWGRLHLKWYDYPTVENIADKLTFIKWLFQYKRFLLKTHYPGRKDDELVSIVNNLILLLNKS